MLTLRLLLVERPFGPDAPGRRASLESSRGVRRLRRIGDGAFDELVGPIVNMFDVQHRRAHKLFVDRETGLPVKSFDND